MEEELLSKNGKEVMRSMGQYGEVDWECERRKEKQKLREKMKKKDQKIKGMVMRVEDLEDELERARLASEQLNKSCQTKLTSEELSSILKKTETEVKEPFTEIGFISPISSKSEGRKATYEAQICSNIQKNNMANKLKM